MYFVNRPVRGVFRILILRVLSVNKIFILHPQLFPTVLKCQKIAGANSLFFKIAGAKAPIAPVLNTPLDLMPGLQNVCTKIVLSKSFFYVKNQLFIFPI